MPPLKMIPILGNLVFMAKNLKLPTDKAQSGDDTWKDTKSGAGENNAVVHVVLRAGARRLIAEGAFDVRPGQSVHVSWRAEDVRTFPR